MAYWAAHFRSADHISALPADITQSLLWRRYVGDTWAGIADALSRVPVSDLATPPEALHAAALNMSAALRESLFAIGFRYTEDSSGSAFYINRPDFPSE